ncbi:hypothetical protein A9Q96_13780 [Rhodobacterales bacterium 52_120_T64]|nr:hypothetical protein A9Q96_13780 [Rhodobacterales bacterium 52_120_T64]
MSALFPHDHIEGEAFIALPDQIRQQAVQTPDKIAICDETSVCDWSELLINCEELAKQLIVSGVTPGDNVALIGDLQVTTFTAFLSVLFAGACVVPLPAIASDAALSRMLLDSGASMVLSTTEAAGRITNVLGLDAGHRKIKRGAIDFTPPDDSWTDLRAAHPTAVDVTLPSLHADALFNIIYSSGTTGTPKGIVHDNLFRFRQMSRMHGTGVNENCTMFVSTAIYSNTTIMPALSVLSGGGTLVTKRKFEAKSYIETARKNGVTHAMLVPTLVQRLLAEPSFQTDSIPTLERTFVTASPFATSVKSEAVTRWPGVIHEIYGMTEGGLTAMLDTSLNPNKLGSVGKPSPSAIIRIIDDAGSELPTGQVGEIIGHSNTMMLGYHKRPEQNSAVRIDMPDGLAYFRTGDLGRFDDDGFLYVVGRAKDVIISGGFNIYATDLEDALLLHPDVNEAAVMGMPSAAWGETPVAAVVLSAGSDVSEADLISFANEQLGKAQRISALKKLEKLPLNALGKVVKSDLGKQLNGLVS